MLHQFPRIVHPRGYDEQLQHDGQPGVQDGKDVFFLDVPEPLSSLATAEPRSQSRRSAETPVAAWLGLMRATPRIRIVHFGQSHPRWHTAGHDPTEWVPVAR